MDRRTLGDGERYELLDELASGGMATVYLARLRRPIGFSRLVAIKCMHAQFAKDPNFVSMFMDEARLTARLRHPNIVPTLDIIHEDGHLLLVMDYVDGASLSHLLRASADKGVRIPAPIACAILHDVLLGLHEAHQAKDDDNTPLAIVHRDVSPQNIHVGIDGLARVLDFGVAKARQNTHHTNQNEIKGKIPYMPPEQLFGEALDHKVDVYAAGVTLWEALVGNRLFEGPSETALVRRISEEPIAKPSMRLPDLSPEIDAIVMKALSRTPGDRYESALAMAEAIAAVVKLPTRTEVSAWVRQFIAPRTIPTPSKVSVLGRAAPATMLAALEKKGTVVRPSTTRPAAPLPRSQSRRLTVVGITAIAMAFAIAGIAAARIAKNEAVETRTTTGAMTVLSEPDVVRPPVAEAPILAQTPVEEVVETPRASGASLAPSPIRKPTNTGTKPAHKAGVPDTKSNCSIPFTIDSEGHKHYKLECI